MQREGVGGGRGLWGGVNERIEEKKGIVKITLCREC